MEPILGAAEMKILSRYFAREFTQNFVLGWGAFSTTYLIVEFFERINAFMYNHASLPMMAAYFLNKIPAILYQVSAPAILLAAIITLGHMSRHNEVMAMKDRRGGTHPNHPPHSGSGDPHLLRPFRDE